MPPVPIDPLSGPKLALAGRVVCMDAAFTVHDRATVYIENGGIVDVCPPGATGPPAFAGVPVVETGGTLFPGLIELHNHLAYNILRLWAVPQPFTNRGQWTRVPDYPRLVSGPMRVIGKTPELLPAVARYTECKCLLGGVTTTQGLYLASNQSAPRYYKGIVRNVEQTGDPALPEAGSRVGDVAASSLADFRRALDTRTCYLLHLAEGLDQSARNHFLALHDTATNEWAIRPSLAGIHSAALKPIDYGIMRQHGAAIVWSPLSNLLLYGGTADITAAKAAGVRIGLGADWSPSGSKSLLGELKVAYLVSRELGGVFSDRELVAMATCGGAAILGWQQALGSLAQGRRADLLVVKGTAGDPYQALIRAKETAITLVMINGVPRYGVPAHMTALGVPDTAEKVHVGGSPRRLYLEQISQDPVVQAVTLTQARTVLAQALRTLPARARAQAAAPTVAVTATGLAPRDRGPEVWTLALDELLPSPTEMRPRIAMPGLRDAAGPVTLAAAAVAPEDLPRLTLDPLTVADHRGFLAALKAQKNLPQHVKDGLDEMYG